MICAVDRGMVKGMLAALYGATDPELAASLPQGDARLRHGVRARPLST